MTYPEPSSQVLGRNLWQSGNKHSKLHLVSFKLRFFEDAADERGNQMAVVEVKKKKEVYYICPSHLASSIHSIRPSRRRLLQQEGGTYQGRGSILKTLFKENVSMHICTCRICFQISGLPHEMFFPSSILQLLSIAGV